MTIEIKSIRPQVISEDLAAELDDYLSFRHVFRNIYGFELKGERLDRLVAKFDRVSINFRNQLNLYKVDEMNAELANGRIEKVDIVGPVDVRFKNRSTTCRAAVFPGDIEVLFGSIPMEDMDVILIPKEKTIDVNPESPYIAKKKMK